MSYRSPLPVLVLFACAVACTKQDRSSTTADSAVTPAATAAATPTSHTVTVTARDFAFEAPTQVPAGVTTLHLMNKGKELHHLSVLKFEQGKTLADFMAAMKGGGPLPAWVIEVGGPNAPVPDGGEANATITLDSGNYAFACFVDTPDHVPHLMKGMVNAFTVTPVTTTAAAEPIADVTVTLSDYSFALSKPLTKGTQTIRVENTAVQTHEIEIVQLSPGKTIGDLTKWAANYQGPPPARPVGGMSGIGHGRHGFFTVDLPPGEYGLICFYPDMKDGKPHFMHGMQQQITIS